MSVFHLKYRPKKIADLDLAWVRNTLVGIFEKDEFPQSFLFCGPKGSGKTSAARIIAKIVNCENPKNGEACGKCKNCLLIDEDRTNLDIIEMDAASNRGIDDVRIIKEKIYLSPINLTSKVFVIDEVHMLTKEAFNALLKILEEPPKNVYFVLCTTNPEKIPETVMSRLVRVDFKKGNLKEMIGSLEKVVKGENLKLANKEKVLEKIAGLSEGSFRNGQKILMELVMNKGKNISLKGWDDFCKQKFSCGAYGGGEMEADLNQLKIKKILDQLEELSVAGVDMVLYRQRLMEYFQKRLVENYTKNIGSGLSLEKLIFLLRLLIQAGREEKEAVLSQLPLQLAVVDFGQKYSGDKEGEDEKIETDKKEKKLSKPMSYGFGLEDVIKSWKDLLTAVRPYNHSVEAFLRSARPVKIEGNKLVVEVFYKFHKERLEADRNRKIVEFGLQKVFSAPMLLECVLALKGNQTPVYEAKKDEEELYDVAKEIFGE